MAPITKVERERRKALHELGIKQCSTCSDLLPIGQFRPNARGSMGLRSRCIDCDNAGKMEYQKRTPELQAERQKRWRDANLDRSHGFSKDYRDSHPLEERLRAGRLRAERAGLLANDITAEELLADWERRGIDPTRCVYTGEPLADGWHLDHAVPLRHPATPGHIVGNLVPCIRAVNSSKGRRHWVEFLADRAEAERVGGRPGRTEARHIADHDGKPD